MGIAGIFPSQSRKQVESGQGSVTFNWPLTLRLSVPEVVRKGSRYPSLTFTSRILSASRRGRRGRGGVFDLVSGVGWVHALIQTAFPGNSGMVYILMTKAVAEYGAAVSALPALRSRW